MLSGVYHLDNKLSVPLDWPLELIVSDKSTEMAANPSFVDSSFHEEVVDSLDEHEVHKRNRPMQVRFSGREEMLRFLGSFSATPSAN